MPSLHPKSRVEEETSKMFNLVLYKIGESAPAGFNGVRVSDIPIVKGLVQVKNFLYDIDCADGAVISQVARTNVSKHSSTVRLIIYNSFFPSFPISMFLLKLIVAHRLITFLIKENQNFIGTWPFFDFESICLEDENFKDKDENFKDTETTLWFGKHIPMLVSTSSNLIAEPLFFCDPNLCELFQL